MTLPLESHSPLLEMTPYSVYLKKQAESAALEKSQKPSPRTNDQDYQKTELITEGKIYAHKSDQRSKKIKKDTTIAANNSKNKSSHHKNRPAGHWTQQYPVNLQQQHQAKLSTELKEGGQKPSSLLLTPSPKDHLDRFALSLEKSLARPYEEVAISALHTNASHEHSLISLSEVSNETPSRSHDRGKASVVTISSTRSDNSSRKALNPQSEGFSGEIISQETGKVFASQPIIELKTFELIAKHVMWDLPLKRIRKEKLFLWLRELNYKIPELFLEIIKDREQSIKRLS